jgi:16S rRNA (uracil1498-N3)-methyltransferase
MLPRFLADAIDLDAGTARLAADETRHLAQVLRLIAGDDVAVFDGAGREYHARVERIARDATTLRLIEAREPAPEPGIAITLAQAILKGDKMDDVVRDATMMGAAAIEPLVTEHTLAHMKPGGAPERWRRIAVASAKQCGRAVLPAIGPGRLLAEWLAADIAERRLILVEPNAPVSGGALESAAAEPPVSASLLVGPEGGWSGTEIEAAVAAGYVPITLGRRTLRADAVAIIAMAALQTVWRDL